MVLQRRLLRLNCQVRRLGRRLCDRLRRRDARDVGGGRHQRGVPEKLLDDGQRCPALDLAQGPAVPKPVGVDALLDAGLRREPLAQGAHSCPRAARRGACRTAGARLSAGVASDIRASGPRRRPRRWAAGRCAPCPRPNSRPAIYFFLPPARRFGMGTRRVSTGTVACRTTRSATLPMRKWATPVRPDVAMTMLSARRAASMMR